MAHKSRSYWAKYDTCPLCKAEPKKPCKDMRSAIYAEKVRKHDERKQLNTK